MRWRQASYGGIRFDSNSAKESKRNGLWSDVVAAATRAVNRSEEEEDVMDFRGLQGRGVMAAEAVSRVAALEVHS